MAGRTLFSSPHGFGEWLAIVFAAVVLLFGIPIFAGGVWLASLGGSFYYALAGVGLIAAGILVLAGFIAGLWTYFLTYVFTVIWALWEAGFDGWAQVPRLVAPTILALVAVSLFPVLYRRTETRPAVSHRYGIPAGVGAAVILGIAAFAILTYQAHQQPAAAQSADTAATKAIATPAQSATVGESSSLDTGRSTTAVAAPSMPAAVTSNLQAGDDWPTYGGSEAATRFSPLDEITPENVAHLQQTWLYQSGDMPSQKAEGKYSPETTPIKIGDSLYLCSPMNIIISLDAKTGKEEWRYDPIVSEDAIPYGATCRGVAFFENPGVALDQACARRIIEATLDARLIAVDAATGQPCADFGNGGEVSLDEGIGDTVPGWYAITSAPTIVRGIVVVGAQIRDGQAEDAPSGVVRGYDALTGKLAWAWDLAKPELTGEPPKGEVYSRGTPNMWTTASGDEELGLVYVPLGNSSVDYYGGNRSAAENKFSTSLVALDVETGKPVWHFQTVHYDVWDYDLGSQVSLVDFPTSDGTIPALILPSKQGEIYVLDRRNGEPLFPVEEKRVPHGGVEPENLSPTQPFSGYATLAKARLTEKDMWGMTPLDQMICRIQFRLAAYDGIYTPPTVDRHYIQYPGYNGGSDWGSLAVDTDRGILIANYNDMPNYNRLLTREEANERNLSPINVPGGKPEDPQAGAPYAIDVNAGWRNSVTGLMCKQPPYGGIRAIELATGKTLWDEPLGTARRNGPFHIPSMLPFPIGTPNNGGPVVTAGGVTFVAATTDDLIRAIDTRTGEVLWTDSLPAGGQATPMVFEVDGREYLVIMAGGHHFMETPIGDYVIAYALPQGSAS